MTMTSRFVNSIEDCDLPTIESFILRGLVDVNARLPRSLEPPALVRAAELGFKEIVDILLRFDARVDDTDNLGRTACHAAAEGGHWRVLALLLARQPNLAAVDMDQRSIFRTAVNHCDRDRGQCALMLLEAGAPLDARANLCEFAAKSTAAIQALLDRGVVVRDIRDWDNDTLLHKAAAVGHDSDLFTMLVNVCGSDLEARNRDGVTCVHFAVRCGNVFALRWLLNAGADTNCVVSNGSTPLHEAFFYDCAVVLLAAGANVCARDNGGRTALHRVADELGGDLTCLHPLLAAGADLDATDDAGETARQVLARRQLTIEPGEIEAARRDIAKARIDFVRDRALQVCIGLQSLELDALQTCEILQFACGAVAPLIPFHVWWQIATTVKHAQKKETKQKKKIRIRIKKSKKETN